MPNVIDANGVTVATRDEILAKITTAYQTLYGSDINIDSDTPDGQFIGILIQIILDQQDVMLMMNAQFDPDQAIGKILDQRVALNGVQRQDGTYTIQQIDVTVSQALNIYGLDQDVQEIYTVQDPSGNQFQLVTTQNFSSAGVYTCTFQAAVAGAVQTIQNTITIPVTIVLGVTSVNNPNSYISIGLNEETDAQLKIRRQKSVSLASQGYKAALEAALENISGMVSSSVEENNSSDTDANGIPGHSIWVIVSGTADNDDIAQAIYTKRNAGCGMRGDITEVITQKDGSPFIVRWDSVITEPLFIQFTVTSIDGVNNPNIEAIREQLPQIFIPGVSGKVNVNDLATKVQEIDPNTLVTGAGFSLAQGGPYTTTLQPSALNKQFEVLSANIIETPMQIQPAVLKIAHLNTRQFQAFGGYGAYTFSLDTNDSGGTIDASTGVYTAGSTFPSTDIVKVTDSVGNFTTSTVTVT